MRGHGLIFLLTCRINRNTLPIMVRLMHRRAIGLMATLTNFGVANGAQTKAMTRAAEVAKIEEVGEGAPVMGVGTVR